MEVVPNAIVAFSCLDIASFDYVFAESDGSFEADVLAPPGTALLVKHFHDSQGMRHFLTEFLSDSGEDLEIDPLRANYRYVFHWVTSRYKKLKALGQGPRSDLNVRIIKSFPIALPSVERQNHIARLLDKFELLVND